MGRAPRTKETLPDFREKCQVTRHSRVFPRDPRDLGRHKTNHLDGIVVNNGFFQ